MKATTLAKPGNLTTQSRSYSDFILEDIEQQTQAPVLTRSQSSLDEESQTMVQALQ
jgi:hypothetical protein